MKKLMLIAMLMLALVLVVVACTENENQPDTSSDTTIAEMPTGDQNEESTVEVTEEPTEEMTTIDEPGEEVTTVEEPTNEETTASETPDVPGVETETEIETLDMGSFAGQTGYNANFNGIEFMGSAFNIGSFDLSKYDAIILTYGCDGGQSTADAFAMSPSLAIGIKSENISYGIGDEVNMDADIAHGEMEHSGAYWKDGARDVVIDLTNIDYNGDIWVSLHNPTDGTWICIFEITFVTVKEIAPDEEVTTEEVTTEEVTTEEVTTEEVTTEDVTTETLDPEVQTETVDIGNFAGQAGYNANFNGLEFMGSAFNIGSFDLSKYSAIVLTYGCDGGQGTADAFAASPSLALGIKSENISYGIGNDVNMDADIAHGDMVHSSAYWKDGARDLVIDLTDIDYNGDVWLSLHNPTDSTWIIVFEIKFILADDSSSDETPEEPEQTETVDIGSFAGQAGYNANFNGLEFMGSAFNIGSFDLSKYSAIVLTYGCDGGQGTADAFAASPSLALGIKSENISYGIGNDVNMDADIAHGDMVHSSAYWKDGARDLVIDLTDIDYNGDVWLSLHNPTDSTWIIVFEIEFILA